MGYFVKGDIVRFEIRTDGEPRWDYNDDRGGIGEHVYGTVDGTYLAADDMWVDYYPGEGNGCPCTPGQCNNRCFRWNWPNEERPDREGWITLHTGQEEQEQEEYEEDDIIEEMIPEPQYCNMWAPQRVRDVPLKLYVLHAGNIVPKYAEPMDTQTNRALQQEGERYYKENRLKWPICTIDNETPAGVSVMLGGASFNEVAIVYLVCPACRDRHKEEDLPF